MGIQNTQDILCHPAAHPELVKLAAKELSKPVDKLGMVELLVQEDIDYFGTFWLLLRLQSTYQLR